MASIDFIPRSAPLFDLWQDNYVIKVNLYKSSWNLSSDALNEWNRLTTTTGIKKMRWDAAWAAIKSGDFKPSEELEMTRARRDYESGERNNRTDTSLRIFNTRYVRNNPLVTDEQKKELHITVTEATITPTTPSSARLNAETDGSIKRFNHLQHILSVSEPGRKSLAKDAGIAEISVFIAITDASVKIAPAISSFQYDGEVKRGLYTRTFGDNNEGMRAWYYFRKKSKGRNAAYGHPSAVISGIIP